MIGLVAPAALALAPLAVRSAGMPQDPPASAFPAPRAADVDPDRAIADAIAWLLANQAEDGGWGSHRSPRPIEVLASFPGSQEAFRVATTALCALALDDAAPSAGKARAGIDVAVGRALDFLLVDAAVKRQSGLEHYNVWSFGYALHFFGEHLQRHPADPRAHEIRAACERVIEKLGLYQTLDGGWGYLSLGPVPTMQPSETSMSFTTATILVGIERVRRADVALPEALFQRAVGEVRRARLPDGAFLYGDYLQYLPRHGINERSGSACRAPLCLYTLELFGEPVTPAQLEQALVDLLVRFPEYQKSGVRRPIPHESWFAISGYFYLYGHAYAAYALEELPPATQKRLAPALVRAVLYCRDPDGSFWDYPLYSYHKPYGTAFALLALTRARAALGGR
jgi:hypothetical protein